MSKLLRAELLKLLTTRGIYGYLLALVSLSGIAAAAHATEGHLLERSDPAFQRDLVSDAVFAAWLIALLLGIVLVTVEWRHGSIVRTFLVTPRRQRVVLAKSTMGVLLGIAFAVVATLVVVAVAGVIFSSEGTSFDFNGALAARMGEIILAAALWGALGVGVGVLVQNQTAAVVAALLAVIVVEQLVAALLVWADLRGVAHVLPGQALGALEGTNHEGLSPAAGGGVGLCYVVVFTTLGWLRVRRQDIT